MVTVWIIEVSLFISQKLMSAYPTMAVALKYAGILLIAFNVLVLSAILLLLINIHVLVSSS